MSLQANRSAVPYTLAGYYVFIVSFCQFFCALFFVPFFLGFFCFVFAAFAVNRQQSSGNRKTPRWLPTAGFGLTA